MTSSDTRPASKHGRRKMNTETESKSAYFFFNDTATTEIYTLSLHDALPIYCAGALPGCYPRDDPRRTGDSWTPATDRKSTRLNSSHGYISYAVFCLKKKKNQS